MTMEQLEGKACKWCSATFKPRRGGRPQIFCGRPCKRKYERAVHQAGKNAVIMPGGSLQD